MTTNPSHHQPTSSRVLLGSKGGYQYGGRPLNLSFVKYLNQGGGGSNAGDAMEAESHGGLTQDQMM